MSRWSLFPEEIRLQVLETLAHGSNGKRGLTNYSLVCKSWQRIFEKANFQRLILSQSDLDHLARIPRRCWPYVRHIWLRMEIDAYHPTGPLWTIKPERLETTAAYNELIEIAIGNLFSTLKAWEKVIGPTSRGMTLEMSVHSPSDSRYVTRGAHAKGLDLELPRHLLRKRADSRTPHVEGAVSRVFGGYVHIKFYRKLPQLNLVKGFTISRHTRRRFTSFTLHQILHSFPHLEYLAYEPWKQIMDTVQDMVDAGYVNFVKGSLPAGLKQVTFLEDHEDEPAAIRALPNSTEEALTRKPNPYVGAALANRSLKLEHLSASFLIDANDFFKAYKPEWIWRDLRTLTLTSQCLELRRNSNEINDMLQAAGEAALAMPMLETLEIWNGSAGHGAIFQYQGGRGEAAITWISTWSLAFNPHAIDAWQKVAYKNHRCQSLTILQRPIAESYEIRRYADVVELLKTRKHAMSRQSLNELRYEIENGCMCFP